MQLLLGAVIIAVAVYAIVRRVDVRLVLLLAALALGSLAGQPMTILRKFLSTFADEKFVVPICTAMGFAYVLRHTGCDQHLIQLLVQPLRRWPTLLIPGTVLVAFCVNIPVISQTSTAVTVGAVAIPLLLAARISPGTTGAAVLLGSSVGGELLNPGAPELRTTVEETLRVSKLLDATAPIALTGRECVDRILPLNLMQLGIATALFWMLSVRFEAQGRKELAPQEDNGEATPGTAPFQVSLLRAAVPLVPLLLLFLTGPPLEVLTIPRTWLVEQTKDGTPLGSYESRLIGAAMLAGAVVAAVVVRSKALETARAFFDGAGYAFTHIISLIVTAACFGEGIKQIGLAALLGGAIESQPALLFPTAGLMALSFGLLSGSGMAATQSLFGFFVEPALRLNTDPAHVGAVVSLAAAAGRTMSPVAAVTLMCAALTKTEPVDLMKRVAGPLLVGVAAVVLAAALIGASN